MAELHQLLTIFKKKFTVGLYLKVRMLYHYQLIHIRSLAQLSIKHTTAVYSTNHY